MHARLDEEERRGREELCSCLENYSIEVTPAVAKRIKDFGSLGLPPHSVVNVTYLPNSEVAETIEVCRLLKEAQLCPVAHVPARSFASLGEVDEYFKQLRSVGVDQILVLAGGVATPCGELSEAMDILNSGLVTNHGFRLVGVAAHPEGHPDVADDVLMDALIRKVRWAREQGVELYFATQFCFEPEPIIKWEAQVRERLLQEFGGVATSLPRIHLGLAGPAKIASLIKFASFAGIGQSMRFFAKYTDNALKLATTAAPDALLLGIASYKASESDCLISSLHFYPFGGFGSTVRWANQVKFGKFTFTRDGLNLVVETHA
jgi:methylenetetrahydrofolate reductase (NADPH)